MHIAGQTNQRQIVIRARSAMLASHDVVDLKWQRVKLLRNQTVLAKGASSAPHPFGCRSIHASSQLLAAALSDIRAFE